MFFAAFRPIWAICKKDLAVWLHRPANVIVTLAPPVVLLLIIALGASAVGRSPVALVTLDSSPQAMQMRQIFHDADVFRITDATSQQAAVLFDNMDVVAVITIPAGFAQRVQANETLPIDVTINNLNLDFTNDIRRAVPDVITQFYHAQGAASPIQVSLQERDLRSRDVQFFEYMVLPSMVLQLVTSGLFTSGLSTAREWESKTIKELLLAPATNSVIITGKVLAGWIISFSLGLLVLGLGYLLGWIRPEGVYWLNTLLIVALVALFSAGLGVALGALTKRLPLMLATSMTLAIYLFFLSGGVTVLAFEPAWLQSIATFVPLTYGSHALQMAVFYRSSDQFGRDVLVLALSALLALILGTLALRRGTTS